MNVATGIAINEIIKERERQNQLKAEGRFMYTCADQEMDLTNCMLVLMEEVGELCRAVLEEKELTFDRLADHVQGKVGMEKIRNEVVQVGAVALAMCERFVEIKDAD